jgi:hypothetical protein
LIAFTTIKLLTQLASTHLFGNLIFLLKHLVERIISFGFLVAFELFTFAVIGMMLNEKDEFNNLQSNFDYLFEGTMFGEYRSGALFPLQVIFTIT